MGFPVEIDLLANIDKAVKSVNQFAGKATRSLEGLQNSFAAIAGFSFAGIGFKAILDETVEANTAINKLTNSLRLTDEATQANVDSFRDFAESLSEVSKFDDDVILGQIAYVKSLGATNDEARKVVQAATELSAVIGGDLSSNVEKVTKSFSGNASQLVKENIPGIKALTAEQLKAGAAIDVIISKFGGSAQAELSTFAGQIALLKNEFGDLLKAIGGAGGGKGLIGNLLDLAVESIRELKSLSQTISTLWGEGWRSALRGVQIIAIEIAQIYVKIVTLGVALASTLTPASGLKNSINAIGVDLAGIDQRLQKFQDGLGQSANAAKEVTKETKETNKELSKAPGLAKSLAEGTKKAADEAKKLRDEIQKSLQSDPIGSLIKFKVDFTDIGNLGAFGAGITKAIGKGAAGAQELIAQSIGAAIGGPLGQFGAELFNILAQGPDKVRETITAFLEAIPNIIQNVIDSIGPLFETIAEKLPTILNRLIEIIIINLPRIASQFGLQLSLQAPIIAIRFATEFIKNIPHIVSEFVKEIGKQISSLGGLLGGGSGGGGILGEIGGFLGLSHGGTVPGGAPYVDRIPALLTPGERVIPRDEVNNSQGQPQMLTVNLIVGEEQLASVLLNLNRQGFRTA